jgi:Leucine-rich repeat (LRR) protein
MKMGKSRKSNSIFNADESYTEAQRLIKQCREKGKKKLDFSHLSLKAIPPEIAELETLAELDITRLSLTEIPDFIGNIGSLKRLAVECNYSETVPASIGRLNKLCSLRIYGEKISELPGEIGDCRSLEALELQCLRLKTLPLSFSKLEKLRVFKISHCNFTAIPDYICGWTELEELVLSMANTFQGPYTDFTKIPQNIGNLKKLKMLTLDGTGIRKIPASLGECPLEQLTITGDFKTLPETFGNLSKLKELKMYTSNLRTLPESFGNLSSLEEFELRGGVMDLPASFGNLSSLKDLTFFTSGLNLPETLGKLSSLKKLYIDDDKMTALPKSIGKCSGLKQLSLDCDNLTELPSSIGNLINLERFSAGVFNLKKVPDTIGNLTELEHLDIFSGALTAFPESLWNLKKLKYLSLDAYHVKELPESFKKLSYVEQQSIDIGRKEPDYVRKSRNRQKKRSDTVVDFEELQYMGYQYRGKILEKYSLKELEALLCSAPTYSVTENDKEIVKDILFKRSCRLNRRFSWTEENIKRIATVSDKFLAAWEEGFAKAKTMIDIFYEKETDKDAFWHNYTVEIILHPYIFAKDEKTGEWEYPYSGVYFVLTEYLPEWDLTMDIGGRDYNPATKDEKGFRENINSNHELSWNIEGFGDIDLKDQYICYAIHVLYSHNEWANKDILKINSIDAEIRVTYLHNSGVF